MSINTEEKTVKVGIVYNAFDPTDIVRDEIVYQQDETLRTYITGLPDSVHWQIGVNGIPVKEEDYDEIVLKPDDVISIVQVPAGGFAKDILRIVAMVAIVVAAFYLFGPQGVILAGGLTAGGSIAATAAFVAFVAVGGYLVSKLLPPKLDFNKDAQDGQSYGYDGAKNTAREGVAIPVVYGQFHQAGNYIDLFTENLGDDQYLYGRTILSDGKIGTVGTPFINEQSIEDFKDIEWGYTQGDYNELANDHFGRSISQFSRQVKLDTNFTQYTTTGEVDAIQLNFAFPRGLVEITEKKGKKVSHTVSIVAEYRKVGDTAWQGMSAPIAKSYKTFTGVSPASSRFRLLVTPQDNTSGATVLYANVEYTVEYRKLGDTNWTAYKTYEESLSSFNYKPVAPAYNPYGRNVFNEWQYVPNFRERTIDITLPSGQYEFRTTGDATTMTTKYEDVTANGAHTVSFTDSRVKTIRRTIDTFTLPRGVYEVRVKRSAAEITDNDYIMEEIWLTDVGEIQNSKVAVRSVATGWFRAKMTDQLSGIPNIIWPIEQGVEVDIYDENGNITSTEPSSNPAWVTLDMLISERRGTLKDRITIDYPAYVEWAEFCTANGLEFNGIYDTTQSLWDAIVPVYKAGRAAPVRIGTKLSVAIDKLKQPVMLFGPGNIYKDSFSISYLAMTDRANEFEVTYYDRNDKNKQKTLRVVDPVADQRGDIPNVASYQLFGVDNFEQAKKELWYQLYSNRLLKRTCKFDAPIESIGLSIGDVALIQHDMVDWGTSGRLKAVNSNTEIVLDKPVTIETGKVYSLLVIHDKLQLATCAVTPQTGNTYHLTNISDSGLLAEDSKKLLANTGDEAAIEKFEWLAYNTTDGYNALVTLSRPVSGDTGTIYNVDAIEERTVATGAGETDTLTLTTPLSALPNIYSNYMFGVNDVVKKPFMLRSINGDDLHRRTLTFVEYNEYIYSDPEADIPEPTIRPPKIVEHVKNISYIQELRRYGGADRIQGYLSWNAGHIADYAGVDIYVARNDGDFVFEKTVLNVNEAQMEFKEGDSVRIRVVAFNTTLMRAPIGSAPEINQELITSPEEIDEPTGLAWVTNKVNITATGTASWTKPTINIVPRTRVQLKLEGESDWDDFGVTTESSMILSDLPAGSHTYRIRSENLGGISIWVEFPFTVSLPALVDPVIASDGTAVDHTINEDGSANLSFEWTWAGTESDIDGFVVTIYRTTSSAAYVLGTDSPAELEIPMPPNKRSVILNGIPANKYYTFGVKAYKKVDKSFDPVGRIFSNNVQPSNAGENPYQPSSSVAFSGNVTGTVNNIPATQVNDWQYVVGTGKPEDFATRNNPRGTYSAATAYDKGDIVNNADNSKAYIAVQNVPAGTVLTNTTYWSLFISAAGGAAGENAIYGILTNQAHVVATDSAGNGGVYTNAGGTFRIFDGTTEKTSSGSVTYSVVGSPSWISINSVGVYTVSNPGTDSATATLQATYNSVTLQVTYTIAKSKQGADGADGLPGSDGSDGLNAKTITVTSDRQTIGYDKYGALNPTTQTTTFTANKQNTAASVTWSATKMDGTVISPVTNLLSASTGNTVTMTAANFDAQRGSTLGVIVTASVTDGTTITDKISVIKVQDGAAGASTYTLEHDGQYEVSPGVLAKSAATGWTTYSRTSESYFGGSAVSAKPRPVLQNTMLGLTDKTVSDPTVRYAELNYAFYFTDSLDVDGVNRIVNCYESGVNRGQVGKWNPSGTRPLCIIQYVGNEIIYTMDGAIVRRVATTGGQRFYGMVAINTSGPNAGVENLTFSGVGARGVSSFSFEHSGGQFEYAPGVIAKSGTNNWDSYSYTQQSYVGGAAVSGCWKLGNVMIGFTDKTASHTNEYEDLNYALYLRSDGTIHAYEFGAYQGQLGTFNAATEKPYGTVLYTGTQVMYIVDGTVLLTKTAVNGVKANQRYYGAVTTGTGNGAAPQGVLTDFSFTPAGANGEVGSTNLATVAANGELSTTGYQVTFNSVSIDPIVLADIGLAPGDKFGMSVEVWNDTGGSRVLSCRPRFYDAGLAFISEGDDLTLVEAYTGTTPTRIHQHGIIPTGAIYFDLGANAADTSGTNFFGRKGMFYVGHQRMPYVPVPVDGQDAISVSASPPSHTISCDYAGNPIAGQFNKTTQITAIVGTTDVTESATFSITTNNCTATVSNTAGSKGLVTFTGMQGGTNIDAYAAVTVTYSGVAVEVKLPLAKALNASPDHRVTDNTVIAPSTTTFADCSDIMNLDVGPGGTIKFSFSCFYEVASGGCRIDAQVNYRDLAVGGTWSTLAVVSGSSAISGEPGSLTLNQTLAGPASTKTYEVKLQLRKSTSTTFSSSNMGSFSGTWE